MSSHPEHRALFERQLQRLMEIGMGPVGLYGAGRFGASLVPRARDPWGVVDCFLDADARRQGHRVAGVPVVAPEAAADRGLKSVIITAAGSEQDAIWEARRPLRAAGLFILTCPSRFEERLWDESLIAFYDRMLARANGLDRPWTFDYPSAEFRAPQDVVSCLLDRLPEGGRVCEIGAGFGLVTEHLIGRAGQYRCVDFSGRLLHEVIEHRFGAHLDKLSLHHDGTASLAGVPDGATDLLVAFDVFVHLPTDLVHQFLASAKRVLAPEGRAVIHFRRWDAEQIGIWERHFASWSRGKHSGIYFNDLPQLEASCRHLGLTVSEIDGVPATWSGYLAEFRHA